MLYFALLATRVAIYLDNRAMNRASITDIRNRWTISANFCLSRAKKMADDTHAILQHEFRTMFRRRVACR